MGAFFAKRRAQRVKQKRFGAVEPLCKWQRATALAHPSIRCRLLRGCQECIADLRKQMCVLMAVDIIGRAAKQLFER